MLNHEEFGRNQNATYLAINSFLILIQELWNHREIKKNRQILRSLLLTNSNLSNKITDLISEGLKPQLSDFYQSKIPLREDKRFFRWVNAQIDFNSFNYFTEYQIEHHGHLYTLDFHYILQDLFERKKLTKVQIEKLSFDQIKTLSKQLIRMFIIHDLLTIDEVFKLTEEQIGVLNNEAIFDLILNRYVTINEAISLSADDLIRLNSMPINYLISARILSVEKAKSLSLDDFNRLNNPFISDLIRAKFLNLDEIKQLEACHLARLKNENISHLVIEGILEVNDVRQLNDTEFRNLSNQFVSLLVKGGILKIDQARQLSEENLEKINLPHIYAFIMNNFFTLDQMYEMTVKELNNYIKCFYKSEDKFYNDLNSDELIIRLRNEYKKGFSLSEEVILAELPQGEIRTKLKLLYLLIEANKISQNAAKNLGQKEISILNSIFIRTAIIENTLTVDEALNFSSSEISILSNTVIQSYISLGKLSITEARCLKHDDFLRLCTNRKLYAHIFSNDQTALQTLQKLKAEDYDPSVRVFQNHNKRLLDREDEPERKISRKTNTCQLM